jgi:hypothetical protein
MATTYAPFQVWCDPRVSTPIFVEANYIRSVAVYCLVFVWNQIRRAASVLLGALAHAFALANDHCHDDGRG